MFLLLKSPDGLVGAIVSCSGSARGGGVGGVCVREPGDHDEVIRPGLAASFAPSTRPPLDARRGRATRFHTQVFKAKDPESLDRPQGRHR